MKHYFETINKNYIFYEMFYCRFHVVIDLICQQIKSRCQKQRQESLKRMRGGWHDIEKKVMTNYYMKQQKNLERCLEEVKR